MKKRLQRSSIAGQLRRSVQQGGSFTQEMIETFEHEDPIDLIMPSNDIYELLRNILRDYEVQLQKLEMKHKTEVELLRKGDTDLDPGVIRQVRSTSLPSGNCRWAIKWRGAMVTKVSSQKLSTRPTCPSCQMDKRSR